MKKYLLLLIISITSTISFSQANIVIHYTVDGTPYTTSTTYFIDGSVFEDIIIRPQTEFTIDSVKYVDNGFGQLINVNYKRSFDGVNYALFNISELTTTNVETYDLIVQSTEAYYYLTINITETASIDAIENDKVIFYPNPVRDVLTVQFQNDIHDDVVTIYSVSGQRVVQEKINAENHQFSVDISNLKSGIYFVEIASIRMKIAIE